MEFFRYTPTVLDSSKKYKAVLYKNGVFKSVKPYICIEPSPFYEANGRQFYTSENKALYVYANGITKTIDDVLYYDEYGVQIQ